MKNRPLCDKKSELPQEPVDFRRPGVLVRRHRETPDKEFALIPRWGSRRSGKDPERRAAAEIGMGSAYRTLPNPSMATDAGGARLDFVFGVDS